METENKDVQTTEEKTEETVETYTKEQLDNSFKAGVKKANADLLNDENYKAYLEWKKTNQNDSEKINELQEMNNTLTQEKNTIANENNYLKALIKVNDSNVKKEFSEFVTEKVMKLVSDTVDFDKALKTYKNDNPQYFGDVVVKKVQTSPNLNAGGTKPETTNDIMNNLLRGERN